jgi:hypothetical protein
MTELEPCKKCGSLPEESLQHSGRAFVSYGCCQIRTRYYKSRRSAKEVWNNWQSGVLVQENIISGEVENVGYDIDGVLANFIDALMSEARELGYGDEIPEHWMQWDEYQPEDNEAYQEAWNSIAQKPGFWTERIQPFDDAYIHTDVAAYITNRSVPSPLSQMWLLDHNFPNAPVTSLGHDVSKMGAAEAENLDLFVDDKPEIVRNMNEHGIPCLLMNRPHNWDAEGLEGLRIRCLSQVAEYVD